MELDFGKLFQDRRKAKGLTLESLATLTGVTKSYLSQVENGIRQLSENQAQLTGEILGVEDLETWVFLATKAPVIKKIQKQYPTQFSSLFREKKTTSSIYKKIVDLSR